MSSHQVLKRCSVFSALTSGEIDKIAELASEREYEAGAILFHVKDKAEELFILEEGKIALQMIAPIPPGRMVTVDVACSGDIVGWSSLLEPHLHDLTATCLQRCRVLVLDASRLRLILRDDNTASKIMKGVVLCVMSRLSDTRQLLVAERNWPPKLE
ncbi:MAG: cyclic nucleotide-binding domain-containing protein [Dehalococcoidales bacterium]|nr:cyclic nucleotide-binding domain-containing protein [Dehalococcoidales bacterium]